MILVPPLITSFIRFSSEETGNGSGYFGEGNSFIRVKCFFWRFSVRMKSHESKLASLDNERLEVERCGGEVGEGGAFVILSGSRRLE
jgi:hypothetical protein